MNNFLKKIVFSITIMSISILYANAEECPITMNNQNSNTRDITCNAKNPTLTKFSYPSSGTTEVFKNDLCTIRCKEENVYLIDSAKSINAGGGFRFPLYVSAQRNCTATYDTATYDKKLRDLITSRNAASGVAKETIANQISAHTSLKDTCDNWKDKEGKYSMNPSLSLKVQTSTEDQTIAYKFKESSPYSSSYNDEKVLGDFCTVSSKNSNCKIEKETTSSWTETARIDGSFTMVDMFIELYTGKIVYVRGDKTCSAGDVYFSSFTEKTRPVPNSLTDKGYGLTLTVRNLGQNLISGSKNWNLNINCWYSLYNNIFPQGEPGGSNNDANYDKYGNTAFMYRPIDLRNPFPNREPGSNWVGKETLITGNVSSLASKEEYVINLNPSAIRTIKKYNKNKSYDTFNFKDGKSVFINDNRNIIKRK